jgi:hypothetical protein
MNPLTQHTQTGTHVIIELHVVPVARHDSLLMNLSGATALISSAT